MNGLKGRGKTELKKALKKWGFTDVDGNTKTMFPRYSLNGNVVEENCDISSFELVGIWKQDLSVYLHVEKNGNSYFLVGDNAHDRLIEIDDSDTEVLSSFFGESEYELVGGEDLLSPEKLNS